MSRDVVHLPLKRKYDALGSGGEFLGPDYDEVSRDLSHGARVTLWKDGRTSGTLQVKKTATGTPSPELRVIYTCVPNYMIRICFTSADASWGLGDLSVPSRTLLSNFSSLDAGNVVGVQVVRSDPAEKGEVLILCHDIVSNDVIFELNSKHDVIEAWLDGLYAKNKIANAKVTMVHPDRFYPGDTASDLFEVPVAKCELYGSELYIGDFMMELSNLNGDTNLIVRAALSSFAAEYDRTVAGLVMDILVNVGQRVFGLADDANIVLDDHFRSRSGVTSNDITRYFTERSTNEPGKNREVETFLSAMEAKYNKRPNKYGYYGMWGYESFSPNILWSRERLTTFEKLQPTKLNFGLKN